MKVSEIIERLNNGSRNSDLANELNVGLNTLSRRLKRVGYSYNNRSKKYEYAGSSDENQAGEIEFHSITKVIKSESTKLKEFIPAKTMKKSDKNIIKRIETIEEKTDYNLTEDEVKFIKDLYKSQDDIQLSVEFSMLPPKEKAKKHQIEISEVTYREFEEFAKSMKGKRYSKNDLIEMALMKFMREYRL